VEQCVTTAGYGYSKARSTDANGAQVVTVTSTQCDVNFYNPGSNTLPCRRCPGGLVTDAAGSANVKACKAPPGYLFDKMVAKPCPRGTFNGAITLKTACTKCPVGLTTAATASTAVDQCVQALPGYKVVTAGVSAEACARNSYNVGFNTAASCTDCDTNMVTLATSSKSEASCLAPPGFGFNPTATPKTAQCDANTYKSGFNRKDCTTCGTGFLSAAGADSKQKCYVPTGHGTVKTSDTETSVQKCLNGTFGYAVDTYGVFNLPCRPCQAGMSTWDFKDGNTSVVNVAPEDCWTLPGYGYDRKAQASKICAAGSYAAGWSKDPCMLCADGYTTLAEGATSDAACVIAPGWYWDTRSTQVVPCDEGFYCLGGSLNSTATACPEGTTTSKEGAAALAECDVCAAGYGAYSAAGPTCGACAADTYGPKGSTAACTTCPDSGVAAPKSDGAGDCYAPWQNLQKDFDFLPVTGGATILTTVSGTFATEDACKAECTAACAFYQYDSINQACAIYTIPAGDGTAEVGFKVDTGVYSVIPGDATSAQLGSIIAAPSSDSVRNCLHECDKVEGCVAVVITKEGAAFRCGMKQGALSADLKTQYRIAGARIAAWTLV